MNETAEIFYGLKRETLCFEIEVNPQMNKMESVREYLRNESNAQDAESCFSKVYERMIELDTCIKLTAQPRKGIGYVIYHYDFTTMLEIAYTAILNSKSPNQNNYDERI